MTAPPARRRGWRRAAEAAVVAAFVGFLALALVRQWSQVAEVIGDLSVVAVAVSALATMVGIWFSFLCWRAILTDLASRIPVTAGMRIFFVGQVGKYVPGKVWPILTQIRLGRDYQVPGRTSAAAAFIFMLIVLGTGLLVAICSLPVLGADALGQYWWSLLALPVAAVALWPPVLNRGLGWIMRLARREPMPRPLTAAGIGRAVGWALVMWAFFGVHLFALLTGLDVTAPHLLLQATGAFAGSWSIGFLLLVAPAGVGPREVALVVLLGSITTQPVALVAVVVSRLLMTLGDLVWPVIALGLERRRRAPARPGQLPEPAAADH
ncbi:lysylphosphatidylglycerol synthase domain-containing protein [Micromonospora sp. LOL_021]|uniref:lysylphosphatidylglycerol synthase domain-containing protein n=1 Tax=Micromonospora sp. LOL_021 TaxID=3345417 RepID=UPI003A8BD99B